MIVGRRSLGVLAAVVAALAVPGSPARVSAEPNAPDIEWVKTSHDSVIRADTFRALTESNQFQSVGAGQGFLAESRDYGEYTIRLVTSNEGNIESYRALLQQTANEINAQTGLIVDVAPGTIAGPLFPEYLQAGTGSIMVMISSRSGCGTLSGGALGCGGPDGGYNFPDAFHWTSGVVWLSPTMQNMCRQVVATHEVGHALGLDHFDDHYLGQDQLMASTTDCSFSNFRAGDLNGLRWLAEGAAINDFVGFAADVCPLRDTSESASTWFATKEAGEPLHSGVAATNRSLWWRYVPRPDQNGQQFRVRTTNDSIDDFNTVLAVYSGSMFSNVVLVASNDESAAPNDFNASDLQFTVDASKTYWIAVAGYGFARGETDVEFIPPPTTPTAAPPGVPARIMDTRRPNGQTVDCLHQRVGQVTIFGYQLPVVGRAFVPSSLSVTSVVLNVTVVSPTADGYLTIYPCGSTIPNASNLNFKAGEVIPNLVIAKIGLGGVCIFTSVRTDLLVDVSGYFEDTDSLESLSPARLLDTRSPDGQTIDAQHQAVGRLAANVPYELPVTNRGGVSADAATVLLNVTAVGPGGVGYVTVYPCGQPPPNASNLNFSAGDVIPNLVIAKVGLNGKVCFFSSTPTDLLVDVGGYWPTTPELVPLDSPGRLLDTRNPGSPTVDHLHEGLGRIQAGGIYELPVLNRAGVPVSNVASVVLNVTAVNPSAGGYLTVYPCGSPQPNASNLNFAAGDVIPNSVLANVGIGGKVCFFSSTQVDLLVDVSAYFAF